MTYTVQALVSRYLTWCEKHRAARSCEWYSGHLNGFLEFPGIAELDCMAIKPFHIQEWVDSKTTWGPTYTRGAMVAVQRVYNWAVEQGHLEKPPFNKLKKPSGRRRETYMKQEDYDKLIAAMKVTDPFRDVLQFAWFTGARPQEVRHIEPRHVDLVLERIVFPAEESKGKRNKRIIYIQGTALEIIKRLMSANREGKLFLNARKAPWTKFAVCNRMGRLSKVIGKRLCLYESRHGWATRKLIQGHDSITVAALMGHADGSMLAKIYSHITEDEVYLKKAMQD